MPLVSVDLGDPGEDGHSAEDIYQQVRVLASEEYDQEHEQRHNYDCITQDQPSDALQNARADTVSSLPRYDISVNRTGVPRVPCFHRYIIIIPHFAED